MVMLACGVRVYIKIVRIDDTRERSRYVAEKQFISYLT
jgi:hypothetical protein